MTEERGGANVLRWSLQPVAKLATRSLRGRFL